jgi:hypothetical protein
MSSVVAPKSHKLMILNLPDNLNEDQVFFSSGCKFATILNNPWCLVQQVKELLKPFGALKSFDLLKHTDGKSQGSAIFEYEDEAVSDGAMKHLTGIPMGATKVDINGNFRTILA